VKETAANSSRSCLVPLWQMNNNTTLFAHGIQTRMGRFSSRVSQMPATGNEVERHSSSLEVRIRDVGSTAPFAGEANAAKRSLRLVLLTLPQSLVLLWQLSSATFRAVTPVVGQQSNAAWAQHTFAVAFFSFGTVASGVSKPSRARLCESVG
jgi:hypothetical protein